MPRCPRHKAEPPNGRKSREALTGMCTRSMSFFWLELFLLLLLLLLEASFFLVSMAVLPIPAPRRAAPQGKAARPLPHRQRGYSRLLNYFYFFYYYSLMALGNRRGGGEEAEGRGGVSPAPAFNPSSEVSGGPSQEQEMPPGALLAFSLFRPFKNIRSILGVGGVEGRLRG